MGSLPRRQILQRIANDGHEIGNHGLADRAMTSLSLDEFNSAIAEWERRLGSVLPQWPVRAGDLKWFRPPKALTNPTMAQSAPIRTGGRGTNRSPIRYMGIIFLFPRQQTYNRHPARMGYTVLLDF